RGDELPHVPDGRPRKHLEGFHRRADAQRRRDHRDGRHERGERDDRETDGGDDANPGGKHQVTSAGFGRAVNGVRSASASAAITLSSTVTSTAPAAPRTRSNPAASAMAVAPWRMSECANSGGGANGSDRHTGSTWSSPKRTVTQRARTRTRASAGAAS